MIRALILDFGGVIVTMPPDAPSVQRLAAELNVSPDRVMAELLEHVDWQRALSGEITAEEFDRLVHDRFGVTHDPDRPFAVSRLFADETLSLELLALADALRGSGQVQVAVLSNASTDLEDRILRDQYGILHRFDLVINSSRVGLTKPNPAIYELVLSQLGVAPHQAIFVDDMPANVRAAAALGIHAIQFHDEQQALAAIRSILASAGSTATSRT